MNEVGKRFVPQLSVALVHHFPENDRTQRKLRKGKGDACEAQPARLCSWVTEKLS